MPVSIAVGSVGSAARQVRASRPKGGCPLADAGLHRIAVEWVEGRPISAIQGQGFNKPLPPGRPHHRDNEGQEPELRNQDTSAGEVAT